MRHATPITIVATLAMLAFFLHAATAGRVRTTFRCIRQDNGEAVEVQLRKDLVAHTAMGIVVSPDGGRPFVAEVCVEVQP